MSFIKHTSIAIAVAALGLAGCSTPQSSDSSGYPGAQYPAQSQYPAYPDYRNARYGYVESVEVVAGDSASPGIGVGAIGGAIAGGVLGNQVGSGTGRAAATVGGAVAGGVIGHQVEKHIERRNDGTVYRFRVRMDDGSYQTFTQDVHDNIRPGDRVRIENNRVWAS
jgi:outer membrane lipoprotein SlyB